MNLVASEPTNTPTGPDKARNVTPMYRVVLIQIDIILDNCFELNSATMNQPPVVGSTCPDFTVCVKLAGTATEPFLHYEHLLTQWENPMCVSTHSKKCKVALSR